MRKHISFILTILLALCFAGQAQAEPRDMWAAVYTWDGAVNSIGEKQLVRVESGITYKVLQASSDTAETITVYRTSTAMTNPVTPANFASSTASMGAVKFRVDPTDSGDENVDLVVVDTAGGYTTVFKGFNRYDHTIVIDERPNQMHHGMIWYDLGSTDEIDTGIDFDYDTSIVAVFEETIVGVTGSSIDVGLLSSETSGDANGFLVTNLVSDTGYITTSIASTGAFLDNGSNLYQHGHIVEGANAKSLTYTSYSTAGSSYGGYIHTFFTRMR